jgi:ADP-ribose pyrophosphatase YjhB (NUDIX family)
MKTEANTIQNGANFDERSAGGLVYKIENGKIFWLLIKTISSFKSKKNSNKDGSVYKFPKGHLQKEEFLKQAALREVEEEGRVKAKVVSKLGSNNYVIWNQETKKKIIKKVTFFLMEYVTDSNLKYYDREMVLERNWLSYEDAKDLLAYDSEKVLLRKAKSKLEDLFKQ